MSRKKPTARAEFVLFDVLYEDGTRTSNRKVPSYELDGLEGDTPARAIIEAQDHKDRGTIRPDARPDQIPGPIGITGVYTVNSLPNSS